MENPVVESLPKGSIASTEKTLIHVLHVDDDAGYLKTAKKILEMHGSFQVETASSVEEAMEKMEEKTFDVIVSDYIMPGKDGLEFLKELRDSRNNIPFIIFTGKGREVVAIKALNLGANQYINKIGKPEAVYSELAHGIRTVVKGKKAEEELRDSEKNWSDSFNSLEDVMILVNKDYTIEKINDSGLKLLGKTREEVTGKKCYQAIHGLDAPCEFCPYERTLKTGKLESVDRYIELFDKYFSIKSSPMSNERGEILGFVDLMRDVTEQKKAEEALRESEEKYRKQFEKALDATFLADSETGIIVDCNRAATKLVGRKKSELIGKHQRILHPPEAIEGEFSRTFEQHRKEKEAHVLEDQIITKNGEIRDVIINATAFELEGKRLLQGTFRDITERKRVEAELRREKELMEMVTANNAAALAIISKDFRILWANRLLTEYLGEIKGKVCYSTLNNLTNVCPGCGVKEILETGNNKVVHEQVVPGLNGKKVWLQITAIPIRDKNGNIIAISEMAIDITEQKKAEEALRESEEKYRELLNGMNDTAWVIDFDGNIIDVNDSAVDVLGYSREEFRSIGLTGIDSNLDPEEIKGLVEGMPADEIQVFETVHTTKDGKKIPVEISSSLVTYRGKQAILSIARNITERKRAEKKLRQSEERYRTVFENTGTAMCIIEEDKTISMVNWRFEELSGYSQKEIEGKKWTEFVTKEYLERMKRYHEARRKKSGKPPTHYNFDFVNKKGQIKNCLLTANLIPGTKKSVASILDITEQKKLNDELRMSEQRFRDLVEATTDWIWETDKNGVYVYVSPKVKELLGYEVSEVLGKIPFDFMSKEEAKRVWKNFREQIINKEPSFKLEKVSRHKDGHLVIAESSSIAIFDEKGQLTGYRGIDRDITERKQAEKALREAEEKYRETIVNANVGIIGYDPEGEVKVLNPKMEQMTGFKRSEIPTLQDWFKKLYPNEEERHKIRDKWFKRMSEEGEVKEGHAIITTKDGKRRNFLFNAVRLESGDSIAIAEDITERKEAEEKLDGMMNELVTINEKLGVVGKLTRHDARNKLSVMANNVYLAKQKLAANHSSLEYLGEIESAIDQMEKIFDFARTYEMLGVEELSYMNVEKSVDEAAILFPGLAGAKLMNECQGLTVMADSLLRQLFYNLIDNTLKYGEKVSQIRVYHEEVGKDQLKLVYEDDGVGIPEDEKEKIFKEGYGKSTGYGLYLIKKICEAYGWTIRETGKLGKGAQFTMTIPKTNKNGKISYIIN